MNELGIRLRRVEEEGDLVEPVLARAQSLDKAMAALAKLAPLPAAHEA